jgi:hypothetical protein
LLAGHGTQCWLDHVDELSRADSQLPVGKELDSRAFASDQRRVVAGRQGDAADGTCPDHHPPEFLQGIHGNNAKVLCLRQHLWQSRSAGIIDHQSGNSNVTC